MQLTLSQAILNRYRGTARAARYAVAVVLVTACGGISAPALAQSDPLPQMNGQGPWPAPIGHRQPRAQDLPPDVLRHEGMTRQAPGRTPSGDLNLQICRQC